MANTEWLRNMHKRFISRRLSRRSLLMLLAHAVVFVCAYWLAYLVCFPFGMSSRTYLRVLVSSLPGVLAIKLGVFYYFGHCHTSWRFVTLSDLVALLKAATLSTLLIMMMQQLMLSQEVLQRQIPHRVAFVDWTLTVLFLGGLRTIFRLSREHMRPLLLSDAYRKALIVGANSAGETIARHLQSDERLKYLVVGFVDPDVQKHGSMFAQIPVLGGPSHAAIIAQALGVEVLLVTSDSLRGDELRQLMDDCAEADLELKVIPALENLISGDYALQIRDVDINDLLRRDPVRLNDEAIRTLLQDKTVLVTGAGGSIGSEICRQVLKFHPRRLVLVERAENSLFYVEQELGQRQASSAEIVPQVADICDIERMDQIFEQTSPDVVFHAAAHKHVPMMERNPGEAIKNNVGGTRALAELADRHGVQEFVMISTDKAVNPTSIMGVSKQMAERFIHAFSEVTNTKFVVVRFGNVLASAGSVVPIFQEQIRRGGPITVTHPQIERFFMTIPEASQLVLQSAVMGKGGEIFVLDMGKPVRIVDLARDLVRLSGLDPDEIQIVFTGLRPGEKLYEELYFDDEERLPTPHEKVFVAYHRPYQLDEVRQMIEELTGLAHGDPEALRRRIQELVPEYHPFASEEGATEEASLDEEGEWKAVDAEPVEHPDTTSAPTLEKT